MLKILFIVVFLASCSTGKREGIYISENHCIIPFEKVNYIEEKTEADMLYNDASMVNGDLKDLNTTKEIIKCLRETIKIMNK